MLSDQNGSVAPTPCGVHLQRSGVSGGRSLRKQAHILAGMCLPDGYDKSRKRENLGAKVIFP